MGVRYAAVKSHYTKFTRGVQNGREDFQAHGYVGLEGTACGRSLGKKGL